MVCFIMGWRWSGNVVREDQMANIIGLAGHTIPGTAIPPL